MKKEKVLQHKKQLEKQVEKWKKLQVGVGYLKTLKKQITISEEIINTSDYNSERSRTLMHVSKTLLKLDKFWYEAMSFSDPILNELSELPKELIALKKRIEKKKLSSKK